MKNRYVRTVLAFQILTTIVLVNSCSSVPKSDFQNHYYAADYEDKSFEDVSMDICINKNKYTYEAGLDSNIVSTMAFLYDNFEKYFSEGIKMFSSVTETGWIFYETNWETFPLLYEQIGKNNRTIYSVSMPDSLSIFQKQSNSDFLFFIHGATWVPDKKSMDKKYYEAILTINYSIWNTKNSDLVARDEITTRMAYKNPGTITSARGVILKSASEIFERLPMFEK